MDDYPVELEEIVLAALATDPERRWSTAGELADMLEAFCFSHPQYAASDDAVSEWIRTLVPPEEFEEPSSRVHLPTASSRQSVQELMSGGIQPVSTSALHAVPVEECSEATLRPPVRPTHRPLVVAVLSSMVTAVVLVAAAWVLVGAATLSSTDDAAWMYAQEATQMLERGDLSGAALLVERAWAEDPVNPSLVIELTRLQGTIDQVAAPSTRSTP